MATIKAISSKSSISSAINYVMKPGKTTDELCSGINCTPSMVAEEMQATKELWGKTDGRTYKHFSQNWHADENITAEQAHEIGCELAKSIPAWKGFEVLVVTHIDKDYFHNHFIVNSVNFEDGHKLQWSKYDLAMMKEESDRLCMEHNLSICEKGKTFHGEDRTEPSTYTKESYNAINKAEEKGIDSYIIKIKEKALAAKSAALSKQEFCDMMENQGIGVKWTDKHITFVDFDRKNIGEKKHSVRHGRLEKIFNIELNQSALLLAFQQNTRVSWKSEKAQKLQAAFDQFKELGGKLDELHAEKNSLVKPSIFARSEMKKYNAAMDKLETEIDGCVKERWNLQNFMRGSGVDFSKAKTYEGLAGLVENQCNKFDYEAELDEAKRKPSLDKAVDSAEWRRNIAQAKEHDGSSQQHSSSKKKDEQVR